MLQLENLTSNRLTPLEEQMVLIRVLEDALQGLANQGQGADWHFSKGQEAIAVGVCAALRDTDYLVTHHRTIAHAVAKGVPLEPLVAELLGKATGMNGGMAGEMHLSYLPKRFMFSFQLVGTCIPVAAGLAWAVKNYHKTDDIVVVFHGDAATANGAWHEGVNIAAVQHLHLLLVCENNHLAGNVRPEHYLPTSLVSQRAGGYGIKSAIVDGNDVEAVLDAAKYAVSYIRHHSVPFMLECDTTRLGKHKQGQGDMRSAEEMAELALRDPLRNVDRSLYRDAEEQVARAIEAAMRSPNPVLPKV
mgnify:CR=1 FL=1